MSTTISVNQAARSELSSFGERLIGPDDARYDEARALFNAMIDKRPALIARCATADDVARGDPRSRASRDCRSQCAAAATTGAASASVDDGVVIDLSPMKAVTVDPKSTTVRVGGGCLWQEVDAATQPHASPCRPGSSRAPVSPGSRSAAGMAT